MFALSLILFLIRNVKFSNNVPVSFVSSFKLVSRFELQVHLRSYRYQKVLDTVSVGTLAFSSDLSSLPLRLLIYGKYCSHVESAIATLDKICKEREDVRMKLEVKWLWGGFIGYVNISEWSEHALKCVPEALQVMTHQLTP